LPALGYSPAQRDDLRATIAGCHADRVVDASPARLDRILDLTIPITRVRYRFHQLSGESITSLVDAVLDHQRSRNVPPK